MGRARRKDVPLVVPGPEFDLEENSRFEQELTRSEWSFRDGISSSRKISPSKPTRKPALNHAARVAADKAILNAIGHEVSDSAIFRGIELKFPRGREHRIILHDLFRKEPDRSEVSRAHFSIARSKSQAGAIVIQED